MRLAETVTFGGSALNRADDLRGDEAALARATAQFGARTILLWRGKPLVMGADRDSLAWLPPDHPILDEQARRIFLGQDESGALLWAQDISDWSPGDGEPQDLNSFLDASEQHHPDLADEMVFVELRRIMARLGPREAELCATAKAVLGWHDSHRFCARCGVESRMARSGWQRNCPNCGGQHFPRTDPVVIMLITRGNSVLLGRSHGWPEGMYSLLAGFVEPGESLEAAVRREVQEEAGIAVGEVSYLASQPWPFPSSLMIGCRGTALSDEIRIDPVEIEDAIWVTREACMQAMAGEHPTLLPARRGAIAHFLLQNWLADTLD